MKTYNNPYFVNICFNQIKPECNINKKSNSINLDSMQNFKGHAGHERFSKNALGVLIHETAFFRESATDEFLKSFILNKWKDKDKIKIICGACSTGEEAITLSMLLDEIKDKVSILGMDISENSIEKANSREYILEYNPYRNISADKDFYLWNKEAKNLTSTQKEYRKLFHKFFKPARITLAERLGLDNTKIFNFLQREFFGLTTDFNCKFKLRDDKAKNVKFMQDDINNIDIITSEEKADIITFRNALYHLLTEDVLNKRYLLSDAYMILNNLIKKIRKSLKPKGLLVLGHEENLQIKDDLIINTILAKNKFKPLNTNNGNPTVWQKIG